MLVSRRQFVQAAGLGGLVLGVQGIVEAARLGAVATTPATAFGASPVGSGASAIDALMAQCSPRVIHIFESGQPAGATMTRFVPAGIQIFHSTEPDVGKLAARDASLVATILGQLRAEPDHAGVMVCIKHEPEAPGKNISPTQFRQAWKVYLDLIDEVNAQRTHKLSGVPTFMAYSLTIGRPIGSEWLLADPRITTVGFDVYTPPNEIPDASAFARSRGLSWVIPEWGWASHGGAVSDSGYLARMKSDVAAMRAAPLPPAAVMLFNQGADVLAGHPSATAYWRGLCSA